MGNDGKEQQVSAAATDVQPDSPQQDMAQTESAGAEAANLSRRDFLKTTAAVSAAALFTKLGSNYAYAQGNDRMKVGLIGCGGRGTGAIRDNLKAHPSLQVVAVADYFEGKAKGAANGLKEMKDQYAITDDKIFWGPDNYQKLVNLADVQLVVMATPPGFRPLHIKAAVDAGKHVFAEKPFAVDPAGIRIIQEVAKIADQKKLGIVAGTQRRHENVYIETLKRVHDGEIGDITGGQVYWNQGPIWNRGKPAGMSPLDAQINNWYHYVWLSGDHIVEQHVHNIDVMHWVMKDVPVVKCLGMGGREALTEPADGQIYDHFSTEFEFENGVRWLSMCRQMPNTDGRVGENWIGTKGRGNAGSLRGEKPWRFDGQRNNGYEQEHVDLVNSIRAGKPINQAQRMANSNLSAIMARMSAYTGKEVTTEFALKSKLDLFPPKFAQGEAPIEPAAMPGKTPLI